MAASLRRIGLLAAALGWAAGCNAIFGLTDYEVGVPTSTGAAGGSGGAAGCSAPDDCPGVDETCGWRTCSSGECGRQNAAAGASCTEDGGKVCDGSGSCVECNEPTDCTSGDVCQSHRCVPGACANGQQDGDETDVDCGGSCAPCANGRACETYADCESRRCDPAGGAGGAAGAGGGGTGPGVCAPCGDDTECDGVPNAWCDTSGSSGVCTDDLVDGQPCDRAAQCQSGFCPAGSLVCCDAPCEGGCERCLGADTGGSDGSCATVSSCTCAEQYGLDAPVFEICSESSTECVLRMSVTPTPCQDVCQSLGGECLGVTNDNPDGSCGVGEVLQCSFTGYSSVLCTCSRGCGSGPACMTGQVCTNGTCG